METGGSGNNLKYSIPVILPLICKERLSYSESAGKPTMNKDPKICELCEKPIEKCECCEGCGHICPRDLGELYCPVCFPEPAKKSDT